MITWINPWRNGNNGFIYYIIHVGVFSCRATCDTWAWIWVIWTCCTAIITISPRIAEAQSTNAYSIERTEILASFIIAKSLVIRRTRYCSKSVCRICHSFNRSRIGFTTDHRKSRHSWVRWGYRNGATVTWAWINMASCVRSWKRRIRHWRNSSRIPRWSRFHNIRNKAFAGISILIKRDIYSWSGCDKLILWIFANHAGIWGDVIAIITEWIYRWGTLSIIPVATPVSSQNRELLEGWSSSACLTREITSFVLPPVTKSD